MVTENKDPFFCTKQLVSNDSMVMTNHTCHNDDGEREGSLPSLLQTDAVLAIAYVTILFIGLVTGVFGNAMILVVAGLARGLNKVGKEFMVNLALVDFCVTAIAEPMCIIGIVKGEVFFQGEPWLCHLVVSLCITACFCAFMSLTMLSINHYIYMCHQSTYVVLFGRKSSIFLCILCWVVSFFFEFPNFLGWGKHYFDNHQCIWDLTSSMSYSYLVALGLILLPILVMTICYILIFRHIWKTKQSLYGLNTGRSEGMQNIQKCINETIRASSTLFAIFVVFVVCWAPYVTILVIDMKDKLSVEVHLFITLLAHLHSSANFFIFFTADKRFRKVVYRIWCCGCVFPGVSNVKSAKTPSVENCNNFTFITPQVVIKPAGHKSPNKMVPNVRVQGTKNTKEV